MTNLVDNFNRLRSTIVATEKRFGRVPGSVRLLAVSKAQPVSVLLAAIQLGQYCFAENYLQELKEKSEYLARQSLPQAVEWHFIGAIQSKKARNIASICDWVHSVDRMTVAKGLSKYRSDDKPALNVCIQVNLDNEQSKAGVVPEGVVDLANEMSQLPNIVIRGLMAIPKPQQDFDTQRKSFAYLRRLYDKLATCISSIDSLSAGMSNDFEAAIAEGATIVRVGTALFGRRDI